MGHKLKTHLLVAFVIKINTLPRVLIVCHFLIQLNIPLATTRGVKPRWSLTRGQTTGGLNFYVSASDSF